jgi:ATP-dependent Clp protease ATP-binding subunit ClpC
MFRKFTERARKTMLHAQEEARNLGQPAIGTEHILLGLLHESEGIGAQVLAGLGVELARVRQEVEKFTSTFDNTGEVGSGDLPVTPRVKKVFNGAFEEARAQGVNFVGTEHLLLALVREEEGVAGQILANLHVAPEEVREQVIHQLGGEAVLDPVEGGNTMSIPLPMPPRRRTKSRTPVLDQFSRDLTKDAKNNALDPVIGRENEIERVIQILSRRSKNNPVLIGDPGVGKTAIIEGLAQRIVDSKVPETLSGKRVVALDLSGMVAGTKYRGEFEDRLTKIVAEIQNARDVIVFIDELHTIVGAGAAEGAIDAANILKPALARGAFQCVGATTINEYTKYVEKDAALERRFQPIIIAEPSPEESVLIFKGLRDRYEAHHGVKISDEAIEAAVRLSSRYISDRFLPDKAIDLIDEAASRVNLANYVPPEDLQAIESKLEELVKEKEAAIRQQEYEKAAQLRDEEKKLRSDGEERRKRWLEQRSTKSSVVGEEDIANIVASWSGIPVKKIAMSESERLLNMEGVLHERVIGQDEPVEAVSRAVRRARTGIKDPGKPIGSFIFLGPTGVGKTELARALAEAIFGTEEAMVRLDMSEYMEKHAVARMIGSPPGYVGYDEGGQLTEKIRRKPYAVILLDEIEKAHPDVFNILLQVLEDGRMTDGKGRTVDFRNTIIVMTSNVGAENMQSNRSLGFVSDKDSGYERIKSQVMDQVKHTFRPEFLNRVDEVIVFRSLEHDDLLQIVNMMLRQVAQRLKEQAYELEVTDAVRELVLVKGYDPAYGARPLQRAIQRLVEDPIAEELLKNTLQPGDTLMVDVEGDRTAVRKAPAKEEALG